MLKEPILSDDLIIRLVQAQHEHDKKLDLMEEIGIDLEVLRLDILTISLDSMGVPPEDEFDDDLLRDWIFTLYNQIVREGSCEEIQEFLAQVRDGLTERGLKIDRA